MDAAVGELLLAAVGIDAVLEPGRVHVGIGVRERATAIPGKIDRAVRHFLASPDLDDESDPPEFSFDRALELLSKTQDERALEDNLSGFDDPDEALAFAAAAGGAVNFLQSLIPSRGRQTWTGLKPTPPNGQEKARFARAYQIVRDPLTVLTAMNEGRLAPQQVRALVAIYPHTYDEIGAAVQRIVGDILAKRPGWEIGHAKSKQLGILAQRRLFNRTLAADLQAAFSAPEAAQKPPGSSGPLNLSEAQPTSLERVAAR